ncbi:MAG: transposase domain-containing protein [Candidatus Parvibacillus calidus]|nr:MAG: transposase domain-containing protein [Candidatus Parvibacillus calidus]
MTKYEKMADRFAKSGLDKNVFALEAGRKGSTMMEPSEPLCCILFYTCKAKEIKSYVWHVDTLNRILSHPVNRIQELILGYIQTNDV